MPAPAGQLAYRPAAERDLEACTRIWKVAIDDYQGRLAQPPMPDDLSGLQRLLGHLLATDPSRFWVAVHAEEAADGEADRPVGFGSASVRDDLWFLAMLFVEPASQAAGAGRELLLRTLLGATPEPTATLELPVDGTIRRFGTCTDAAQPISNALYAKLGLVPRVPIWRLVGEVRPGARMPALPDGSRLTAFDALVEEGGSDGHRRLAEIVGGIDREVIGLTHPADHAALRRDERRGYLLRAADGTALGYGYASQVGRVGPVAVVERALLAPLVAWLVTAIPANGARAIWLPGDADAATTTLLRAGLRFEGFPGLLCWSSTDTPFERYVPISLALV